MSRKPKINRTVDAVAGHCWVSQALNQMIGVISCVPLGRRFMNSELLFFFPDVRREPNLENADCFL